MKKYFLTKQSALLAMLLGMLGVTCNHTNNSNNTNRTNNSNNNNNSDDAKEYGCPRATFIIKGNIKSESTGNAIQNIQVTNDKYDTTYSDASGQYKLITGSKKTDSVKIVLHFCDIDGTQNGNFQNLDKNVEFDNPQFINGNGRWDKGETSKEINITLKPNK